MITLSCSRDLNSSFSHFANTKSSPALPQPTTSVTQALTRSSPIMMLAKHRPLTCAAGMREARAAYGC